MAGRVNDVWRRYYRQNMPCNFAPRTNIVYGSRQNAVSFTKQASIFSPDIIWKREQKRRKPAAETALFYKLIRKKTHK